VDLSAHIQVVEEDSRALRAFLADTVPYIEKMLSKNLESRAFDRMSLYLSHLKIINK
jgi:hypothetical protein